MESTAANQELEPQHVGAALEDIKTHIPRRFLTTHRKAREGVSVETPIVGELIYLGPTPETSAQRNYGVTGHWVELKVVAGKAVINVTWGLEGHGDQPDLNSVHLNGDWKPQLTELLNHLAGNPGADVPASHYFTFDLGSQVRLQIMLTENVSAGSVLIDMGTGEIHTLVVKDHVDTEFVQQELITRAAQWVAQHLNKTPHVVR